MSNPLTTPQVSAGLSSAPGSPALNLDEIQGNVLLGLQKFFERFLFFEIADVSAFKAALGIQLASRVTSTTTVQAREAQLQSLANQGSADVLPNVGLNLGFTQSGIQKLVPGANLNDASFAAGAAAQAVALGDPINGQGPGQLASRFSRGNDRRRLPDYRRNRGRREL